MDALGFTINNFEKKFNDNKFQAIDYSSFLNHLRVSLEEHDEISKKRINKYVTFKKWKNSMRKIILFELKNGEIRWNKDADVDKVKINTECDKVIFYSLKQFDPNHIMLSI